MTPHGHFDRLRPMILVSEPLRFLLVALAGWINQQQREVIDYLQTENRVLREQLGSRRLRFTDDQRIRLAAKAKCVGRRVLQQLATVVSPDTLLAWHRHLIARKYDGHQRRGPGRPPTTAAIRQLVVRMAMENRDWGYTCIRGALANLGHNVGRGTIATILRQQGIEPLSKSGTNVPLAHQNHEVQALAADRPDHPLAEGIRLWSAPRCFQDRQAHRIKRAVNAFRVDRVAIVDHESLRLVVSNDHPKLLR